MHVNLPELQTLLYQLITTPEGAKRIGNERRPAPGRIETLVRGDQRLSAIERLTFTPTPISTDCSTASMRSSQQRSLSWARTTLRPSYGTTCWRALLLSPRYSMRVDIWIAFFATIPLPSVGRSLASWRGWKEQFWMSSTQRTPPHSVTKLCARFLRSSGPQLNLKHIQPSRFCAMNGAWQTYYARLRAVVDGASPRIKRRQCSCGDKTRKSTIATWKVRRPGRSLSYRKERVSPLS